jgi:hypothetical protein
MTAGTPAAIEDQPESCGNADLSRYIRRQGPQGGAVLCEPPRRFFPLASLFSGTMRTMLHADV